MTKPELNISEIIYNKLSQAFKPETLEIIDESHRHIGHGPYRKGGQSHLKIVISAAPLADFSKLERQKSVQRLLADEIRQLHAISFEFV
ncbi:MAG: BolA family transcriptional regulator [Alphaproteobacteria bacterium CG11_big_fil_rev_8_21_14_0_20_44_7]|nr:MAG: BolA family transcriptional regulator [Alphaproteobacteria bacterium CG11_big_fil_rev_8_21_14_0_20_44_7]